MIKCRINAAFLLLFLFFRTTFLVMAQNRTLIPVNVGVVLDLDTRFGKMGLSCISMALSDFYSSYSNYTTRLVLHTRNSVTDVVAAAGAALDLINNVEVQAIIGLESSMQANFVIDLGAKAQVPIISFSATSPTLQGSYFFRIAQNDLSQVAAISSIIQAFGWSGAVPISVDNEFGKGVIPYLTTALQAVGAHVPYWSIIPSTANDEEIVAELNKLKSMQTRVFIVHMETSLGSRIFSKAKGLGMMDEGYVWIITNGMTNSISSASPSVDIDNMHGVLGLNTYFPNTKEVQDFRARWQRKFQQDNPTVLEIKLDVFGLWAHDAAWALAMAIEKVGTTNFSSQKLNSSGNSTDLERLEVSRAGPKLIQELTGTSFRGLSGDFSLVDGQLQSSTFQVINVNDNGERGVGYWTPENGLVRNLKKNTSASNASLAPIIWPGDTTSTPVGWQIPMNGRNLKILVPLKKEFEAFVDVIHDPNTNTTKVTGYCIDVFKAVIDALPYPVPYEFHPFATPDGKQQAGSYNDLVNEVFLGNYDAAVGDITIRANRSLYVDFTLPYTESGITMVVPIKGNSGAKNTWVFLKPWSWDLWVTAGSFFIIIASVVWFLEHRINEDFQGPPGYQIGTSIWFSLSTMVFAHREPVEGILARFVVIVWCFVVLILTQSYTASLSSILTIQQLQPIVTDVNLLIKNRESVGYLEGSFFHETLRQVGFQDENLKTYSSPEELDILLQKGSENHGISAAFDETPYMKLFLARYCSKYTIVVPTFKADGFAFVFRKGSLLTRDVSTAIIKVHEGDKIKAIEEKWFKNSCSNSNTEDSSNSLTLSLDSFRGLFIVASVASALAIIISVGMFLYEQRRILTDRTISLPRRLYALLKAYDKTDTSSYAVRKKRKKDGVCVADALESPPNTIILPRPPSEPTQTASGIVLQDLGTPSPEQSDLNSNGKEIQEIIELASLSEVR